MSLTRIVEALQVCRVVLAAVAVAMLLLMVERHVQIGRWHDEAELGIAVGNLHHLLIVVELANGELLMRLWLLLLLFVLLLLLLLLMLLLLLLLLLLGDHLLIEKLGGYFDVRLAAALVGHMRNVAAAERCLRR